MGGATLERRELPYGRGAFVASRVVEIRSDGSSAVGSGAEALALAAEIIELLVAGSSAVGAGMAGGR